MNVVEFIFFVGFPTCAFVVGRVVGRYFGISGWCVGTVLGIVLWGLFVWLFRAVSVRLGNYSYKRPTCLRGKCTKDDYKCLELRKDGTEFLCKCGDKYVAAGNRFLRIDEKGFAQPFMKRRNIFSHWKIDLEK